MKITAISDIHGDLIHIEPTDLLIIAGDWSPLEIQQNIFYMREWMKNTFVPYLEYIRADKIILIAGNHDFICDDKLTNYGYLYPFFSLSFYKDFLHPLLRKHNLVKKVSYLCNSSVTYKGLKIFGCPYVEGLKGWAFSNTDKKDHYKEIRKCDILVTHQPPLFNKIGQTILHNMLHEFGSYSLLEVIQKKKPKLVFCGHVHGGDHNKQTMIHPDSTHTLLYNCAIKNEEYKIYYKPQIVILEE